MSILGKVSLLNEITNKLSWLAAKSSVHSQNIALGDTPNYQRQEIREFKDLLSSKGTLTLGPQAIKSSTENVSKEWEVMAQAEAAAQHQAMVGTYKKYMSLLKTVMGVHS